MEGDIRHQQQIVSIEVFEHCASRASKSEMWEGNLTDGSIFVPFYFPIDDDEAIFIMTNPPTIHSFIL